MWDVKTKKLWLIDNGLSFIDYNDAAYQWVDSKVASPFWGHQSDLSTLLDFRYRRRYEAPDGEPGRHQNMTGADGADVVIPVPCGTSVIDTATGNLIGDLVEKGQRLLVATGGRGGKGNWEFRSARNLFAYAKSNWSDHWLAKRRR